MPTSARFRPRRLLALATDSLPARAYLGLVALGVVVLFLAPDSPYAMAPALLTAPLSFLPVVLPFGAGTAGAGRPRWRRPCCTAGGCCCAPW